MGDGIVGTAIGYVRRFGYLSLKIVLEVGGGLFGAFVIGTAFEMVVGVPPIIDQLPRYTGNLGTYLFIIYLWAGWCWSVAETKYMENAD